MYPGFKVKIWGTNDFDVETITYTQKAAEEKK
jgi:hypothetical protein